MPRSMADGAAPRYSAAPAAMPAPAAIRRTRSRVFQDVWRGCPVLTAGRCCDYRVDVTELERRIAQALVDRRCSSCREVCVMLIRHRKAKQVGPVQAVAIVSACRKGGPNQAVTTTPRRDTGGATSSRPPEANSGSQASAAGPTSCKTTSIVLERCTRTVTLDFCVRGAVCSAGMGVDPTSERRPVAAVLTQPRVSAAAAALGCDRTRSRHLDPAGQSA